MTSSPERASTRADRPLPPALSSMWRLCKLGYRHEPRLMLAAFVLSLLAALPDALLALWLMLLGKGVLERSAVLTTTAAIGLAVVVKPGRCSMTPLPRSISHNADGCPQRKAAHEGGEHQPRLVWMTSLHSRHRRRAGGRSSGETPRGPSAGGSRATARNMVLPPSYGHRGESLRLRNRTWCRVYGHPSPSTQCGCQARQARPFSPARAVRSA